MDLLQAFLQISNIVTSTCLSSQNQIIEFFMTQFDSPPCPSRPLRSTHSPKHPVRKHSPIYGGYADCCLMACDAVQSDRNVLMFQRQSVAPSSGQMNGDRSSLLRCDAVLLGTEVRAFRRKLVDQYSLKMKAVGLSETLE